MTATVRRPGAGQPRAEARARPQLTIVQRSGPPPRPRPRPRDRRLVGVLAGGLVFASVLGGNVAIHAQTTQGQFELERLNATARQRQAQYQQLRLQVAELEAPQRIVARAQQLGLIEPAVVTYLTPTADTSANPSTTGAPPGPIQGEAAQGWAQVKPSLDKRR